MARRRFGRIRRLPSGRWQARYRGPDGIDRAAPETFATKTEAAKWLTNKEAEINRDDWINPESGQITLRQFATDWVTERPKMRTDHTAALCHFGAAAHRAVPRR